MITDTTGCSSDPGRGCPLGTRDLKFYQGRKDGWKPLMVGIGENEWTAVAKESQRMMELLYPGQCLAPSKN